MHSIRDIAAELGAEFQGDGDFMILGAAEPAEAGPDDLAIAMSPKYEDGLKAGRARAAILWPDADWRAYGLSAAIFAPRPRFVMSGLTRRLDPGPDIAPGIHPTACIAPDVTLGEGAAIGPFVVIGAGVEIGAGARIAAHVSIGAHTRIGADALIHPGVRIGAHVVIGRGLIAQPNAVIGGDGFSYVTPEKSRVESAREGLGKAQDTAAQSWTRIHSVGGVRIGDDVEIGSNATIDSGTIRPTSVGDGTKIDNLVQVGHNVEVGRDCLLCALVGIAGSTRVGDRVVMAGQCGISDNIFIGDDVVLGGATKIFTNVPAGRVLWGYPGVRMDNQIKINQALRRLPRLFDQVRDLQNRVPKDPETD